MNSSTFNFKPYFLTLVISFYSVLFLSAALFFYKPQLFYWRAWEFFSEIVYNTPNCNLSWNQEESGDMSRTHAFTIQDKWKTTVTCDAEGYRSVPYHADQYPVLVIGDSHTWGSGLSDHETMVWKLAEAFQIPIFNGSRGNLECLLRKESLKEAPLILELFQSSIFNKQHIDFRMEEKFSLKSYTPLIASKPSIGSILNPKRCFLPYKIFRFFSLHRLLKSLGWMIKEYLGNRKLFDSGKTVEDLEYVVERIVSRSQELDRLGHQYVVIPIPIRDLVMAEEVTPRSLWWESELIRRLNERGVYAIDLLPLFREHRKEEIYFKTDTHWNAKGVELALTKIVPYLKEIYENDFSHHP